MCRIPHLVCVAVALLTACSSGPSPDLTGEHPEKVAEIKGRIGEIFDAAEQKDRKRLDASQTRALEHVGLETVEDLSMQSRDLKIDVLVGRWRFPCSSGDRQRPVYRGSFSSRTNCLIAGETTLFFL
jgi:hypothetical protein